MGNSLKDQHYKNMDITLQMDTSTFQAESVSYAVCQYYGIDTSANSMGYIAGWSKDKSLPELKASLDTITKTVNGLITTIDKHFAEICKERGIDLTTPELPVPEEPDTPENYVADFFAHLDGLYAAGLEAGTITLRDVRAQDFELPPAQEPVYVYKMDANPQMEGAEDRHYIEAYGRTPQGELELDRMLFAGTRNRRGQSPPPRSLYRSSRWKQGIQRWMNIPRRTAP